MDQNKARRMYKTGIDTIDLEHKMILTYLDSIYEALSEAPDQEILLEQCSKLVNVLRSHYDHEERLMLKHFFPDTEAHIGLHMTFLKMVGQYIQLIKTEDYNHALSTVEFLMKWKMDHILEADKKYADFIRVKPA